jgi:hypothetical protein
MYLWVLGIPTRVEFPLPKSAKGRIRDRSEQSEPRFGASRGFPRECLRRQGAVCCAVFTWACGLSCGYCRFLCEPINAFISISRIRRDEVGPRVLSFGRRRGEALDVVARYLLSTSLGPVIPWFRIGQG